LDLILNDFFSLQCDAMVEEYEEEIETWYFKERDQKTLTLFLCENIILKTDEDKKCLLEKLKDPNAPLTEEELTRNDLDLFPKGEL
jgi:hypothetical protein